MFSVRVGLSSENLGILPPFAFRRVSILPQVFHPLSNFNGLFLVQKRGTLYPSYSTLAYSLESLPFFFLSSNSFFRLCALFPFP